MAVRFNVLGPMEVVVGDRDLTPTAPKIRQVLALLISRHNTLVHTSEIVDELWGERPPASALVTLQTYIYKLRKLLFALLPIEERVSLRTRYSGYLIITPAENIDQYRFEELARQGRAELESGSVRSAAERLRSALSLWRGPGLGGIEVGSLLTGYLTRLEESRLRVLQNRIEADLSLGRHRELISELKELTVARSLDEGFHGQLMSALNLAGRRSEALDVYRRFRRNLIDQLGLEPSAELQNRHNALLSGEVTTTEGAESPTIGSIGPSGPGGVACVGLEQPPAQLPHDIADFVGRAGLLNDAADWLTPGAAAGAGLRVLALSGMPGVGKTSLAVRVGHRLRGCFDGGQLFCDLGGSATPRSPVEVLRDFLRAAGFTPQQLTGGLVELSTLFRTWSAGRRLLVVLDDVASVEQVRPLLPAGERCGVLVTARAGVHGLPGARVHALESLTSAESLALLGLMIGADRVDSEREQAARIAELCGHLPLAVRCVGARLSAAAGWPISRMAGHLESSGRPLDLLRFDGLDVRRSLATGIRGLTSVAWWVLRELTTLPASFTVADAAQRIDADPTKVEAMLVQLVGRGLLRIVARAPTEELRFGFHPLARWFAREQRESTGLDGEATQLAGCLGGWSPDNAAPCPRQRGQDAASRAHHGPTAAALSADSVSVGSVSR
ncbi:DNA-binding transcriptional activator of the SARP family [Actinoalloteichus hymeniacidonis]|uniref:DNA-binding transcriptional activator of the SARP family n=3 Tax=Actinoalloteichus hymeniacidonis TaxID=340345 RepID=A0AAC9MYH3_9PSEU|nr:DNA-binding transcriptional activator of the SARP family [Actinoalloteichus hymeniacidonis]